METYNKSERKEKKLNKEIQKDMKRKGYIKIDWGRQGGVILAYIMVFLCYYGITINMIMVDELGRWISFIELDRTILFWTYKIYGKTYFLQVFLLFFICFFLTYKEDIPHYGIKASIWLVPFILIQSFIFYWIMFGFKVEAFILQFSHIEGYLNLLILYAICLSGALIGMKVKKLITMKQEI